MTGFCPGIGQPARGGFRLAKGFRSGSSSGSLRFARREGPMNARPQIPAEAVELYSQYIHGEVSRRDFFEGLKRYAVGGLTVAALSEALLPNYALGQQVRKDDERIKASYETIPSPNGNGYIRGYFVRP